MTIKVNDLQVRPEITTYGDNYSCVADDRGDEKEYTSKMWEVSVAYQAF